MQGINVSHVLFVVCALAALVAASPLAEEISSPEDELVEELTPGTALHESELIEEVASKEKKPFAAAFGGGGFRAFSASIGLGKALHTEGLTSQMSTVAGCSGGSWFATFYTYSKKFFDKLNKNDAASFTKSWFRDTDYSVPHSTAAETLVHLGNLTVDHSAFQYVFSIAVAQSGGWEAWVTKMFETYDPHFKGLPSSKASYHDGVSYDLIVNAALLASSLMTDGTTTQLVPVKPTPKDLAYPASWVVDERCPDGCWQPKPHFLEVKARKKNWWEFTHPEKEKVHLPPPTVAKATSMSSAYPGIFGDKVLQHAILQSHVGLSAAAAHAVSALTHVLNFQDLSVCSSGTSHSPCKYPDVRLVDGGVADDGAIAETIAHMQKEHGVDTTLRVAALVQDYCFVVNGKDFPGKGCRDQMATLLQLFGEGVNTCMGFLPKGLKGLPVKRIFKDTHPTEFQLIGKRAVGHADISYSEGTYTTVANDLLGVQAGSKVNLLFININSDDETFFYEHHTTSHAKREKHIDGYADLAMQVHQAMVDSKVLKNFFAK